jgi:lipoprotein NlpI
MFPALALSQVSAVDYVNRGNVKNSQGELDGAATDFNRAIELNPREALAYVGLGSVHFQKLRWIDALADFRRSCELNPLGQDYPRLYIWLIRAQLGEKEAANKELADYFDKLPSARGQDWSTKIAAFLRDNITVDDFFAAAGYRRYTPLRSAIALGSPLHATDFEADKGNPVGFSAATKSSVSENKDPLSVNAPKFSDAKWHFRNCQAWFYAGMKRLLAGDKTTAVGCFKSCIETKQKNVTEYQLAQAELKTLTQSRHF